MLYGWHDCGMATQRIARRQRISTTVDPELLAQARALDPGASDSKMLERALSALISSYRRAEIDEAYEAAYAALPMEAPDEWGDLVSFGEAVRVRPVMRDSA